MTTTVYYAPDLFAKRTTKLHDVRQEGGCVCAQDAFTAPHVTAASTAGNVSTRPDPGRLSGQPIYTRFESTNCTAHSDIEYSVF